MSVRLSNLHLPSSSDITKYVNQKNFAMMEEASSFVDRFHYKKAENGLYCKEYVLPDVTPYSLVCVCIYIYIYIYIPDTYTTVKKSPKTIVF